MMRIIKISGLLVVLGVLLLGVWFASVVLGDPDGPHMIPDQDPCLNPDNYCDEEQDTPPPGPGDAFDLLFQSISVHDLSGVDMTLFELQESYDVIFEAVKETLGDRYEEFMTPLLENETYFEIVGEDERYIRAQSESSTLIIDMIQGVVFAIWHVEELASPLLFVSQYLTMLDYYPREYVSASQDVNLVSVSSEGFLQSVNNEPASLQYQAYIEAVDYFPELQSGLQNVFGAELFDRVDGILRGGAEIGFPDFQLVREDGYLLELRAPVDWGQKGYGVLLVLDTLDHQLFLLVQDPTSSQSQIYTTQADRIPAVIVDRL